MLAWNILVTTSTCCAGVIDSNACKTSEGSLPGDGSAGGAMFCAASSVSMYLIVAMRIRA